MARPRRWCLFLQKAPARAAMRLSRIRLMPPPLRFPCTKRRLPTSPGPFQARPFYCLGGAAVLYGGFDAWTQGWAIAIGGSGSWTRSSRISAYGSGCTSVYGTVNGNVIVSATADNGRSTTSIQYG